MKDDKKAHAIKFVIYLNNNFIKCYEGYLFKYRDIDSKMKQSAEEIYDIFIQSNQEEGI